MCFISHFQLNYMKSRGFTLICIAGQCFVINITFISVWTYVTGHTSLVMFIFFPSNVREYYYQPVVYIHMGLLSIFVTSPSRLSGCFKAKLVVDCTFIRIQMISKLTNSGYWHITKKYFPRWINVTQVTKESNLSPFGKYI